MAYILGGTTIKTPTGFTRDIVETSTTHVAMTGRTVKDIRNRKERFILTYPNLTTSQVNDILAQFNLLAIVNFEVTDSGATIAATPVHIDIDRREYLKGPEYRETLTLILTEEI